VRSHSGVFEFVYLRYRRDSRFGYANVYDLEIMAPEDVVFEDHFTLSAAGLTHFHGVDAGTSTRASTAAGQRTDAPAQTLRRWTSG
jgi:hypothetical protein